MPLSGRPTPNPLARTGKACTHLFWSVVFVLASWLVWGRDFDDD